MELYDHGFLEELMALRRETSWETNYNPSTVEENQFSFTNVFDSFDQNSLTYNPPNSSSFGQEQHFPQTCYNNDYSFNEIYASLLDEPSPPQVMDSCHNNNSTTLEAFLAQEDHYPMLSMVEEEEYCHGFLGEELQNLELQSNTCKVEPTTTQSSPEEMPAVFDLGAERKNKSKKLQGQPSKNLMAERRRRKRLNDRLSMLRAIVPKISKMDRTAILGDTIDYMKELLEKINNLQQEIKSDSSNVTAGIFKDVKPNEILIRNSPKFEVERGVDTRVEVCCAGKPGLLLSTVNTLEALGLEIQQCVISCFNDFTMRASCSEELEQRAMLSSEDIKQALFRSAGYGGRCL